VGLERVRKRINKYPQNNNDHESQANALQGKAGQKCIAGFGRDPE
jgi:hypothetical protein